MLPPDSRASGQSPDAATAELLQSVYRYAMSLCAHAADAEDLVQEGWLLARERYGADADRKIVFRIVRNLYIDGWRRATRFPTVEYDTTTSAALQQPDNDSSRDPERSCGEGALARQLARLRDAEREALLLSVVEGYSASEIATLTDRPRGTVLSLVHRAKEKLQRALDAEECESSLRQTHSLHLVASVRNKRSTS